MARRGRPPKTGRDEILAATLDVVHERGIARVTTREIAERMGISEGSIFYHFGDRKGLVKAIFDASLRPLQAFNAADLGKPATLDELRIGLTRFTESVTEFLESGLDVLLATPADAELRDEVHAIMAENDYGPHHGVRAMTAYIASAQATGVADPAADPSALAYLILSSVFFRTTQPRLTGNDKESVSNDRTVEAVVAALTPHPALTEHALTPIHSDAERALRSPHSASISHPEARSPHSTPTTSARPRR